MNQRHKLLMQMLNPNPNTQDFVMLLTGIQFHGRIIKLDFGFQTDSYDELAIHGQIPAANANQTLVKFLQTNIQEGQLAFRIADEWMYASVANINWYYCAHTHCTRVEANCYLKNN